MVYGSVKAGHIRPTRLKTHTPLKFSLPHFTCSICHEPFRSPVLSSSPEPISRRHTRLHFLYISWITLYKRSNPKGPLTFEEATVAERLNYVASGNKRTALGETEPSEQQLDANYGPPVLVLLQNL